MNDPKFRIYSGIRFICCEKICVYAQNIEFCLTLKIKVSSTEQTVFTKT